jgi:hypothetical protein
MPQYLPEQPSGQSDKLKILAPEQKKRSNMYGSTVVKAISKYCFRGSGLYFNTHSQSLRAVT